MRLNWRQSRASLGRRKSFLRLCMEPLEARLMLSARPTHDIALFADEVVEPPSPFNPAAAISESDSAMLELSSSGSDAGGPVAPAGFEIIRWNGKEVAARPRRWIVSGADARAVSGSGDLGDYTLQRIAADTYLSEFAADITRDEVQSRLAAKFGDGVAIEPDLRVRPAGIPNDPLFDKLWGLHNTGQTDGTPDADIDAPEAWEITTGDSEIVVAVIDTGVDYSHPDLVDNIWINPGEIPGNGLDDDGNGFIDDVHGWDFIDDDAEPLDEYHHGTHVAGTIGAVGDNDLGIVGVSPQVSMMVLRMMDETGDGSTAQAIAAIDYVTMMRRDFGVNVVLSNNSWGEEESPALYDAIAAAGEAGILFVAAAGNDGRDADVTGYYPASYHLDNIISVAATDHDDNLAYFSNYGARSVDIAAPGVDIWSTWRWHGFDDNQGTSMAAPHVSGALALLKAAEPQLTSPQMVTRLLTRAEFEPHLVGQVRTAGRLNAFQLVDPDWLARPVILNVVDVAMDDSGGNVDGMANPGETVDMVLSLFNSGETDATNVSVQLVVNDPGVTILGDDVIAMDSIVSLGETAAQAAFRLEVSHAVPDATVLPIEFVVRFDESPDAVSLPGQLVVVEPLVQAEVVLSFETRQRVLADPHRDLVYVIDETGRKVVAIDTNLERTVAVGDQADNGATARYMAISSDGDRLFVSYNSARQVQVFSLPELRPLRTLDIQGYPLDLAHGAGDRLYVVDWDTESILQVDPWTGETHHQLFRDDGSDFYRSPLIETTADGTRLFAVEQSRVIPHWKFYEYDTSQADSPAYAASHPVDLSNIVDFAVDEQYGRIYSSSLGVQVTDLQTGQYGLVWPLPDRLPHDGLGAHPEVPYVYGAVSSRDDGLVRRFRRSDGLPLGDIEVQDIVAGGIGMTSNGKVLYVTRMWNGRVYESTVGLVGGTSLTIEDLPVARFTWESAEPLGTVEFDAGQSEVYAGAGSIVQYGWDFGDGSFGAGGQATHVFSQLGEFLVRLTVTDDAGLTDESTALIRVSHPPVAHDASLATDEDTPLPIQLAGHDEDGDPLRFTVTAPPQHGSLTGYAPDIVYTPDENYHGPDAFSFTASDGSLSSLPATISIDARSINDAPQALDQELEVEMETSVEITLGADDVEGDPLGFAIVDPPQHGDLTGVGDARTYVPHPNYVGPDSFTFEVHDGVQSSNRATVSLSVYHVPVAYGQHVQLAEDTPTDIWLEADGVGSLRFSVWWSPQHGDLEWFNRKVTYTPDPNYFGSDEFRFRVLEDSRWSNEATVTLDITPVNDAPVAGDDSFVFWQDNIPAALNLLNNDADVENDPLQIVGLTQPLWGSSVNNGDGTVSYVPDGDRAGYDKFAYNVSDGQGGVASATVTVFVGAPVFTGDWPTFANNPAHNSYVPGRVLGYDVVPRWAASFNEDMNWLAIADDRVYVTPIRNGGDYVTALDEATGLLLWRHEFPQGNRLHGPTFANGRLILQRSNRQDSMLYSLDAETGEPVWSTPFVAQTQYYLPPLVADGKIWVDAGYLDSLYAYDEMSGDELYAVPLTNTYQWIPSYNEGRLFTWVKDTFREHDPASGEVLWDIPLPSGWNHTMDYRVPAVADGVAYATSQYDGLRAIDLTVGLPDEQRILWSVSDPARFDVTPAVAAGVVYAVAGDTAYAFDAADGDLIRTYPADDHIGRLPIVTDDALIVTTGEKTFIFDLHSGDPVKTISHGGIIFLADGTLYIKSDDDVVWAYAFVPSFSVTDFETTPTGFVSPFSRPLDPDHLSLYDAVSAGLGPADVTLVDRDGANIAGSLVVGTDRVEFIASGGRLPAGEYTATLRSESNAFRCLVTKQLLDGNADGTAGDDFVTTFTVGPLTPVFVSLPDFARGPGQPVNVPAMETNGIPLVLVDGRGASTGVATVTVTVTYDPALLDMHGAVPGPDAPADAAVSAEIPVPGQMIVSFSSPTAPLGRGRFQVVSLVADVPAGATYGGSHVLALSDVSVVDPAWDNVVASADSGLHAVSFFGDTTGNGDYSGLDAQRAARVAVGLDGGFEAFPTIDPFIIADVTANGDLSGLDAQRIARQAVGLQTEEIPPLPDQVGPARLNIMPIDDRNHRALDGGASPDPMTELPDRGESQASRAPVTPCADLLTAVAQARVAHGPGNSVTPCSTLARSASQGNSCSVPRLRFGLVSERAQTGQERRHQLSLHRADAAGTDDTRQSASRQFSDEDIAPWFVDEDLTDLLAREIQARWRERRR